MLRHVLRLPVVTVLLFREGFCTDLATLFSLEERWAKIESVIRRDALKKDEKLTLRIAEACKTVTPKYCLNWVKHPETYWDRCIQREVGLK